MEGRGGDNLAHVELGGRQTLEQLLMVPSSPVLHNADQAGLEFEELPISASFQHREESYQKSCPV